MCNWILILSVVTAIAATSFAVTAVVWLMRMREMMARTIFEATENQSKTIHRLGDTMALLQNRLQLYERHLHDLAQTNVRLRQDVTTLTSRVELTERSYESFPADRILH
ncbi:MAG: hypothetical protein HGA90_05635 [Alphaproteobacteria bacterium]|nr:hypothetical protein [Alphaproteobacteria bacterium]